MGSRRLELRGALIVALVLMVGLVPRWTAPIGAFPLGQAVTYRAGIQPHGVALADLNGDGKLDVASANTGSDSVTVLLGNGDGTLQPAVGYPVGQHPKLVVAADLNGDGKLDLVSINEVGGNVSVLLGNGNGTFQAAVNYPVCFLPHGLTAGDVNGDGLPDVLVACAGSDQLAVLLNMGGGMLASPVFYPAGRQPKIVELADLNGDGRLDAVLPSYLTNQVVVLLGNGNGTFQAAVGYAVGTRPHWLRLGDLNGDGKLDAVTVNDGSNDVSVLLGNGNGTFQPAVNYPVGSVPKSVALADLNGDGRLDVAVANSMSDNVSVLLGNGDGTLRPALNYAVGDIGPFSVAAGDLNGDGQPDLVTANFGRYPSGPFGATVSVLRNLPTPAAPPAGTSYLSDLAWTSAVNGWGPVEKDRSNGESGAGDGTTLTIGGLTYAKGLGVHAYSELHYYLGGGCSMFNAVVGVDDEVGSNGSVVFQVLGDGTLLVQTGVLTGAQGGQALAVAIGGYQELVLIVTDGGNGNASDHADWANATITCGTAGATPTATVTGTRTPTASATAGLTPTSSATATATGTATGTATATVTGTATRTSTATSTATATSIATSTSTRTPTVTTVPATSTSTRTPSPTPTGTRPIPPAGTSYVSDLGYTVNANGWGPVEKDRSNGEQAAGDGRTITLNTVTYAKGLGVHANSDVRLFLGGACSTFTADVGVDDEVGSNGSVVFQVLGDGATLYTSGTLTGSSATQHVSVALTNVQELALIVTDAGDGNGSDHADWADAKVTCGTGGPTPPPSGTSYLSDLTWTSVTNGWGPVERDKSNGELAAGDGRAITLNGVQYAKGLGVHAYSEIHYFLGAACSTFASDVGVDDEVGANGSVNFQVWADGALLTQSGTMSGATPTRRLTASLVGKNELVLIVTDAGDGNGSDHADWAGATITCGTGAPTPTATATRTPPPNGTSYLSDLTWTSVTNGWGPVEKDRSNGELAAGDGRAITLNGTPYAKGLGAHAYSEIHYYVGGACTSFTASVGVDDEVGNNGSVIFQVWGDGVQLYASPTLRGSSATVPVSVALTGVQDLALIVTDAGDGNGSDHADWADAQITCGGTARAGVSAVNASAARQSTVPARIITPTPTPTAVSTRLAR